MKLLDGRSRDTITNGTIVKISKRIGRYFEVFYEDKIGYISIEDIDLSEHPSLIFLEATEIKGTTQSEVNPEKTKYTGPSRSTTGSGTVNVKGYYRKDGTYVRPHSRSKLKRK